MPLMESALRITDRFYESGDPETIERQGRLRKYIVLVLIFHLMLVAAFVKLQDYEIAHPRIIRDVNVSFELTPPPPEPPPKAMVLPSSVSLTAGENPNPGSEAAPKPLETTQLDMPSVEAPTTLPKAIMVPARPVPSHKTTLAAPVATTPTNVIKSPLAANTARVATPPPPVVGPTSTQPLSGTPLPAGAPTSVTGGTGTGGEGTGGTGTGQGDLGAGTGDGAAGGVPTVATRLPTSVQRVRGNIGPYRKDLLMRLSDNWNPKKRYDPIILLIVLDKEGHLVHAEIFQSSGNKKADKEALAAAQVTEYAPLPDWFTGDTLTFRIDLSKIEGLDR